MEIKAAFFCDAATIDAANKLNVLGIFTDISGNNFPLKYHQVTFVAIIKGHRSEIGQHKFGIQLVDSDGKAIIPPLQGTFEITTEKYIHNIVMMLQGVEFPKPGVYVADITVDNHHLRSEELILIQTTSKVD
jgi:hypothetical protein